MAMTRAEVQAMHEKIMANHGNLRRCRGPHDLELISGTSGAGARYRCKLCTGETSGEEARWYMMGVAHGRTAAGASDVPGVHG